MKKTLLILVILFTSGLRLGAQEHITDVTYSDVYRNYISEQDISNILTKLDVGDTLYISSSDCKAQYVLPDTIWKKRVKKPKENKHYCLQYIWQGVPTSSKSEYGFPIYTQPTYAVEGMYLYKGFDTESKDNIWLIVTDPFTLRDIKFSTKYMNVKSPKITNEIYRRMTADSIFYTKGEGLNEEDYGVIKIQGVDYTMELNYTRCTGKIVFEAPGAFFGFKDDQLYMYGGRRIITRQAYNQFLKDVSEDKDFLSLVVIENGMPVGMEYYFVQDTMALYFMDKRREESWEGLENIYYCYAYGQVYKFGGKYYSRDCVRLLNPQDSTYLLSRGYIRVNYRLANAKKWDEKNTWLVDRDSIWDADTCIVAKVTGSCKLIDRDGDLIEDNSATFPAKGTEVPVIGFGHPGDYLAGYKIYYRGHYFALDYRDLEFTSSEDRDYLMRRGQQGYLSRALKAISYDINEMVKETQKLYNSYNKKQIFYLGSEVFDSDYGWDGVEIKFYNCFKKTIKYIYCTLTAYNYFGDVQSDKYGRSSKDVRCIGPIEPGESGTFSFEDIMNNSNGIIHSYRPSKITITFVDNSTITYSGWSKIKPHSDNY